MYAYVYVCVTEKVCVYMCACECVSARDEQEGIDFAGMRFRGDGGPSTEVSHYH